MDNCQWINNKSEDFNKMRKGEREGGKEGRREGEGSILGISELTKLLIIDTFISLCDNSAHKRAGKQKI